MDNSDQRHQQQQSAHHNHQQQPGSGLIPGNGPITYTSAPPYPTVPTGAPPITVSSPTNFAPQQQQLAYHQAQHLHTQQQQQQLQSFWANQMNEIDQTTDFKNHSLPLARIKKIMKADEDVRMISAEAPVVFAKACEMFILELTLRSWIHTEENKRRTLQKNDIAAAISRTDVFDFLVDIIPRDEMKEEGLGVTKGVGVPLVGSGVDGLPYYYVPPVGANDQTGPVYGGQQIQPPPMPFVPWPQSHVSQQMPPQQQHSDS